MVNVEKARTKALQRFKANHVNRIVARNLKSNRRENGDFIYEDVLLMDKVVGTFVFNKKANQVTFEEPHVLPVEG